MSSFTVARTTWLDLDPGSFRAALGRSPVQFRHHLAGHPLLSLPALSNVADTWPPRWSEHHLADDLPLLLPTGETDQLEAGPGDVIRGIDDNRSWVALWFLENVDAYRALLDECLDQAVDLIGDRDAAMGRRGANILVTSPRGVVPAHFDLHHNLLLQIEGSKDVTIGSFADVKVAEEEIRHHFEGGNNNARRLPDRTSTFHLGPGEGVYIPPYGFHWVIGTEESSVSLSCGFSTARSLRTELAYICNGKLRRMGLSPKAPGRSELRDGAKAALVRSKRRVSTTVATATRRARRLLK
jgi:hypothetical protein